MKKIFLIQTENGQIVHDFCFTLTEAIRYDKWYYGDKNNYEYILSDLPIRPQMNNIQYYPLNDVIPVGSIEFVLKFLNDYYNIQNVKPINIPEQLMKSEYLKRKVWNVMTKLSWFNMENKNIFVKSNEKIKGYKDIIEPQGKCPSGDFIVSEEIEIESEWRAFVHKNKLVGLQNYLGDFTMFPDTNIISEMIKTYVDCPPAYTLDVGINKQNGTFIIEVHAFFSCGLYGFNDYNILPKMLIQTFNWITERR